MKTTLILTALYPPQFNPPHLPHLRPLLQQHPHPLPTSPPQPTLPPQPTSPHPTHLTSPISVITWTQTFSEIHLDHFGVYLTVSREINSEMIKRATGSAINLLRNTSCKNCHMPDIKNTLSSVLRYNLACRKYGSYLDLQGF